jgi:energy-converting hydrogenase Eha subunit G
MGWWTLWLVTFIAACAGPDSWWWPLFMISCVALVISIVTDTRVLRHLEHRRHP